MAQASERYRLLGHEEKIRHLAVESDHDYNAPMREAMYGWVEKWLAIGATADRSRSQIFRSRTSPRSGAIPRPLAAQDDGDDS